MMVSVACSAALEMSFRRGTRTHLNSIRSENERHWIRHEMEENPI